MWVSILTFLLFVMKCAVTKEVFTLRVLIVLGIYFQ